LSIGFWRIFKKSTQNHPWMSQGWGVQAGCPHMYGFRLSDPGWLAGATQHKSIPLRPLIEAEIQGQAAAKQARTWMKGWFC
jgi:hypothetical protein